MRKHGGSSPPLGISLFNNELRKNKFTGRETFAFLYFYNDQYYETVLSIKPRNSALGEMYVLLEGLIEKYGDPNSYEGDFTSIWDFGDKGIISLTLRNSAVYLSYSDGVISAIVEELEKQAEVEKQKAAAEKTKAELSEL